jgi:hypothetical protein
MNLPTVQTGLVNQSSLVKNCSCVICTAAVIGDTSRECPYYEDCDAELRANELRLQIQKTEDEAWKLYAEAYARGEV